MANFIPTKKTNPCPACGDTKGKCRTFSDSPVILCMESAGGTQRVGWINTGDTKDGLWAKLIPDDEQTRGKSWQEQQEENARRVEREKAIEREKLKHALPVDDRSPEFRKLLLQLEIKPEDNQDLINRGLSPEDIKRLLIKSVEPKQEVKGIKPNLPGIYNNRISVAGSGYLCPAFDEFGRIVGCQVRIRDAVENKYRWLKGKFSSHLLVNGNKELPLTVLKGDGKDAYLCEGILKPAIANIVHNKTFIGASGGNFTGSPEQLKRILKAVAKDGIVYFCPDGGFNANPHVQRRDRATIKLVQSLGYEVYILDWGQLPDKTAGDVDEISSETLESAIAISASEFFKSPDPDLGEEEWTEPDQEAYQQHERELEEEEELAEAEREWEREQWRENYPIAAKNSYKRLKQFTPDIRINTPLLQKEEIEGLLSTEQAICIRSPMGTGKTQLLKHLTKPNILKTLTPIKPYGRVGLNPQNQERLEAVEAIISVRYCLGDEKWRSIGYRNNLLIQSSSEWGMIHLPTAEANGLSTREIIKEENSKTSSCIDSVTTRYNPEDFDGCNLVLDEANAVVTHLLTARTEVSKRLDETCELLAEALQRAKRIFIMDALLTDEAIAYLQKLAPNKNFIKIQNDYKNPTEITHFVGTEEEVEGEVIVRKNKRNPLVEMILSAERPVICSDSQLFCAAMEHILQKEGKQGVRIDGETSGEEQAKAFLENPDAFIKAMNPDYLIYSPSMESGNSIKIRDYFDEQYSFFFGTINTDSQHQMMFRPRDRAIKRFVWCKEFDSNSDKLRSPFPRTNLRNHKAMLMLDIQNCFARGEDVTEQLKALTEMNKECPHDLMWSCLESIYSYEKSNLRQCLIESLEHSGHQITEIALRDLSGDKIESEAKDETKDRCADDIFNAEDIDASEIEERKKRGKWKDQCAVSKKVLKLQLPDIETTPHWNPDTIRLLKYDERDRVRKLERYWMLNNLDGAKQLQRDQWEKVSNGIIHKYHLRSDYSKVLALIEAGIEQFMDSDKEWKADDPEVQEFIKNCQKHDFKLAFGKAPSKKSHPMRWIGQCLDFFGCDWRDRQRRINGDQIRFYRVVATLRTDMRNPIFYECITKRLNKNLENLNSEKSPETHATTGVDAVTEGVTVFKQYKHFCDTSDHTEYPSQQDATQPMENSNSDRALGPPRPPKKGDRVLLKTILPRKDWLEATVLAVKDDHIEVDAFTKKGKRITRWLANSIAYPDDLEAAG